MGGFGGGFGGGLFGLGYFQGCLSQLSRGPPSLVVALLQYLQGTTMVLSRGLLNCEKLGGVIVGMDEYSRLYLHKADKVVHTFSYLVGLCNTEVVRFYLVPPKYISTYLHVSR